MPRRTYAPFAAVLAGLAVAATAGAAEPTPRTAAPLPVTVPKHHNVQQVQVIVNGQPQTGYLILPDAAVTAQPKVVPPPLDPPATAKPFAPPAAGPAAPAFGPEVVFEPLHPTGAEPPYVGPVAVAEPEKEKEKRGALRFLDPFNVLHKDPKYTHPTAHGIPKPGPEPKRITVFHWWRSGLNSGGSANPIGCGTTMSEYTFLWGSCCRFYSGGFYGDVNKYGEYGVLNGGCGPACRRY